MAIETPTVCIFPPCPAFSAANLAPGRRFCGSCGRPLGGGPRFGHGDGCRIQNYLGSGYYADVFEVMDVAMLSPSAAKIYRNDLAKRLRVMGG